jgi:hypothetical protein
VRASSIMHQSVRHKAKLVHSSDLTKKRMCSNQLEHTHGPRRLEKLVLNAGGQGG